MRKLSPILALSFAACGSTPAPPVKKPTCDAGFCGPICCGTGTTCINDAAGDPVCSVPCTFPTDCMTGDAGTCCMPVLVGGDYKGQSICAPQPTGNTYKCTCRTTTDCGSGECAPLIGDSSGVISGPYVCLPNDGENHDGCGVSDSCFASPQYCATDMEENQFCSAPCMMDSDCGNPNVACCNAKCHQPGDMCCGLCGH